MLKPVGSRLLYSCLLLVASCLLTTGCGPKYTYPADKVPESIEDISKKENNIDAKARVVGKTVGAVFYRDGELDPKQPLNKEINEMIGKVMQAVTRVALSTDLPLDYCATFVRDRVFGTEVSIVRSLDDTKRAYADAVGIEESIKRTVINQGKFKPGPEDNFVMKEVTPEIFLAQQIAQRARLNFVKDTKDLSEESEPFYVLVEGAHREIIGKRTFHFSIVSLKSEDPHTIILSVFKTAASVFTIYKYQEFDEIQVEDYLNRQKLVVDRQTYVDYQAGNISDEELMDKFLMETFYPKGGIRLFGMDLSSQDVSDNPSTALNGSNAR